MSSRGASLWIYLVVGLVIGLVVGAGVGYVAAPHRTVTVTAPATTSTYTTTTTTTYTTTAPVSTSPFTVGAAGTLKFSFGQLLSMLKQYNPSITEGQPLFAGSGEVAQKEATTQVFSLVASADTTTIPSVLFPKYANYEIAFGVTQMVIIVDLETPAGREVYALWKQAQTEQPFSAQWNQTWEKIFDIIAVNSSTVVGVSNPFTDPSGYQAQCVLKLAGLAFMHNASYYWSAVYNNPSKYQMRNTEIDLLTLMYANNSVQFVLSAYTSNAIPQTEAYQQKGFNMTYITLPPFINLGNLSYVNFYHQVNVTWTELGVTKTFACNPVVYTATIPYSAPNPQAAVDFLLLVFSPAGQKVLESYGINPIVPGVVYGNYSAVPAPLKPFTVPLSNVSYLSGIFPSSGSS
ncbi:substrate-binding domain-containing protein [Acidilobus sp.]|uniref:substrate-binding domain-containing protein n=1 Tax=Acidilobus sp. TaxID=1872109 RepID=UPI003D043064